MRCGIHGIAGAAKGVIGHSFDADLSTGAIDVDPGLVKAIQPIFAGNPVGLHRDVINVPPTILGAARMERRDELLGQLDMAATFPELDHDRSIELFRRHFDAIAIAVALFVGVPSPAIAVGHAGPLPIAKADQAELNPIVRLGLSSAA